MTGLLLGQMISYSMCLHLICSVFRIFLIFFCFAHVINVKAGVTLRMTKNIELETRRVGDAT